MRFREFMQLDELVGQFGTVKAHQGPLQLVKALTKMVTLPRGKGSSVSRLSMASGISPARPAKITSVSGPLTNPTFLK